MRILRGTFAIEDFELVSAEIVEAIRIGDQRFGVEPRKRRRRQKA
jgi:hypothetical protein